MNHLDLCALVKALINSHYGWAVADQFEDTFNGESFEEQNGNALTYIRGAVQVVVNSGLLSEDAEEELNEYQEKLLEYFAK